MFAKTTLAIALAVAMASSALAAPKTYSSNPAHDVFVNGKYVGTDPDPTIRSTLARDPEAGR
jgi:outer membrane protein assembly factor BamE (lipoprotein component of BamABCDE complex)